jgi:hypothetical protein
MLLTKHLQCVEITFTNTSLTPAQYAENCQNSTGITVTPLADSSVNANGSSSSSHTEEPSTSSTGSAASVTPTSGGVALLGTVGSVVGFLVLFGCLVVVWVECLYGAEQFVLCCLGVWWLCEWNVSTVQSNSTTW